jgi:hypothetical protein
MCHLSAGIMFLQTPFKRMIRVILSGSVLDDQMKVCRLREVGKSLQWGTRTSAFIVISRAAHFDPHGRTNNMLAFGMVGRIVEVQ